MTGSPPPKKRYKLLDLKLESNEMSSFNRVLQDTVTLEIYPRKTKSFYFNYNSTQLFDLDGVTQEEMIALMKKDEKFKSASKEDQIKLTEYLGFKSTLTSTLEGYGGERDYHFIKIHVDFISPYTGKLERASSEFHLIE